MAQMKMPRTVTVYMYVYIYVCIIYMYIFFNNFIHNMLHYRVILHVQVYT